MLCEILYELLYHVPLNIHVQKSTVLDTPLRLLFGATMEGLSSHKMEASDHLRLLPLPSRFFLQERWR